MVERGELGLAQTLDNGSKIASLASSERSLRPEENAPMHVNGGGILSSLMPTSCCAASRQTCAAETPRCAARRLTLSINSGSAWIISLCIMVQA
jgi:hypothetical protein